MNNPCKECPYERDKYCDCIEFAKYDSYLNGAKDFAEWLCRKSQFEEIDWSGIWDRDEDNKQEFFSIDEVLAEWQKEVNTTSDLGYNPYQE